MDAKPDILRGYRDLISELEEEQATRSQVQGGDSSMLEVLDRVEALFKHGAKMGPRGTRLDSEALAMVSGTVHQRVAGVDTSLLAFQPMTFVNRVVEHGTDDGNAPPPTFWAELGRMVVPWFPPTPRLRFLHGTLPARDAPPPQRPPRAPRVKPAALASAVTPDKMAAANQQSEATINQVNRMHRMLLKRSELADNGWVPFFQFAYHPRSFSTTVENVFHLANLVGLERAEVVLDPNGLPALRPLKEKRPARSEGATLCRQLLLKLDERSWKRVLKTFDIRKPMLPEINGERSGGGAAVVANGSAASEPARRDGAGPSGATNPPAKRRA